MHLLVPFASPGSEAGREALAALQVPNLQRLLTRLAAGNVDAGDADTFSPPHERALAREFGWTGADGALPWAAHFASADGLDPGDRAWGLLSPTHWHVGSDLVSLTDPETLALDEAASRALLAALAPLFDADGFRLAWGAATRWYAAHESLAGLRSASLDRVIGRSVDRWLPPDAASQRLRRLQSEAQMLLHTHVLNDEREARGLPSVNSFWLSGCGVRQPARATPGLAVHDALRRPALAEDWAGWTEAWHDLDAGPIADALGRREPVVLTLAGERSAQRFESRADGWWSRLASRWSGADPIATLASL